MPLLRRILKGFQTLWELTTMILAYLIVVVAFEIITFFMSYLIGKTK